MNKAENVKIKEAANIYDFLEEIIMLFAIHLPLPAHPRPWKTTPGISFTTL